MIASQDQKDCIEAPCKFNEKVLPDGTCKECPAYMRATADSKNCEHF